MTSAASFNGGRSQINLNDPNIGYEFPFLNHFKSASAWGKRDNTGCPDPSTLDANGYPTSLLGGSGINTGFFVPSQTQRPGNYVLGWTGNGTIDLSLLSQTPAAGFSSSDLTSTTGSGRYKFLPGMTSFNIGINAIGSPYISSIYCCHEDDETSLLAGNVFGVQFKARLAEANFGVIRFLNWLQSNTPSHTNWASRKPISYVFYSGYEFRSSIYAGTTTNVGNAYSVSAPSSWPGLVDKTSVIIRFNADATQSGTCSLNVAGTGAINILNQFSNALSTGTNSYPQAKIGNTFINMAYLVYDAGLNAWIKMGGDVAVQNCGINNSVPLEICVQLCAEMGAHPYFPMPVLAADPFTDFIPSLAAYIQTNGPSWMVPRFEGPNETWNSNFLSTNYGVNKANLYGWGGDNLQWYGKVMSVLGQALATVFGIGNLGKTYHVICGIQLVSAGSSGNNPRLSSALYIGTTPQSPYSSTLGVAEAWRWVSHGCTANYMVPALWTIESTLATEYNSGAGDLNAPLVFADSLLGSGNPVAAESLTDNAGYYSAFKTWLKGFGINRMCGYEGGYSPDFTSSFPSSSTDLLRLASKQAPNLRGYLLANYQSWIGQSDATFTAEFPSCFQLAGGIIAGNAGGHTGGSWSALDPDIYAQSPQWEAIKAFNSPKRASSVRMRLHT